MYYSMTFLPYQTVLNNTLTPPLDTTYARNTWEHWHIVPVERPAISPPPLKDHYVDIPGANGKIDLNQSLTGYPTYNNRTGSIEFAVLNDFRNWQTAYTDIMTTIHGKRMLMVYEEDPNYYYIGRWSVDTWKTGKTRSSITLSYDLDPYKWRLQDANGIWLWDPFNFDNGVIMSRLSSHYQTSVTLNSDDIVELLMTDAFSGDIIEDPIGDGYLNKMENVSNLIGNAPIPLEMHVHPSEGHSIIVAMSSGERDNVQKTFNGNFDGKDGDFLITNWNGTNGITIQASGYGTFSWNFRPGRL